MQLYSAQELANIIGISERRVYDLLKEEIFKQCEKGKYDLAVNVQAYIKYKESGTNNDKEKFKEEQLKLLIANREKAELEVAIKKGEVHKSEDVEAVMNDIVIYFRSKMLSIPSKLPLRLAGESKPAKIKEILDEAVNEALEELKDYDPQYFYAKSKEYLNIPDFENENAENEKKQEKTEETISKSEDKK